MADDPRDPRLREIPVRGRRERSVYRNPYVEVFDDAVKLADGTDGQQLRIVQSGGRPAVAMLAVAQGSVALVRTYRYAVGDWEWGIPRGFAHGDDPMQTAREELREELGGPPAELVPLAVMTPDSGLLSSVVHLFLARYSAPVSEPIDVAEVHEVRWVPVGALLEDVAAGHVRDGFTLAALGVWLAGHSGKQSSEHTQEH